MTALVDAVTGLRNTRRAIGDGTLAGRHRLATPAYPPPRAKGQTATHDDPAVDGIEPGHVHIPSTELPSAVEEGAGSAGVGPGLAAFDHIHAFALSELTPEPVTTDPGAPGGTGEPADAGHAHQIDVGDLGIPAWDVAATPDTLALRSETGTLSVAPPSAPAHAIPESETSVPPSPDTIGRRTATGELQAANATAALSVVNRQTGDARYVEVATGANPQVMTNALRVPSGTEASPALEIGIAGTGLTGSAVGLTLVTDGVSRVRVRPGGIYPVTAGFPFGLPGNRWGDVLGQGLIETTYEPDSSADPAISAPNGSIKAGTYMEAGTEVLAGTYVYSAWDPVNPGHGTDPAQMGRVYADQFLTYGNVDGSANPIGMRLDPKNGSVQARNVDGFEDFVPMEASAFTVDSDPSHKTEIRPAGNVLDLVLATRVDRYRRIRHKVRPREESDGIDASLEDTSEEFGLMSDAAPAEIVAAMTGGGKGINVYSMASMLWHAFQQSHESTAARLDALETR